MKKRRTVLLSSIEIPSTRIGSWNILLTSFLRENPQAFDSIISPKPAYELKGIHQIISEPKKLKYFIERNFNQHYSKKIYWKELKKNIKEDEIIEVVIFDDIKILLAIDFYVKKNNLRKSIKILFFLRGYNFDVELPLKKQIYEAIDKLIVQTKSSIDNQIKNSHVLPFEISILRNGINSNVFYPLKKGDKAKLKKDLGLKDGIKYFLWISQDRPKKGLSIILKAWRKIVKTESNVELLILGTNTSIEEEKVKCFGRKPNKELASYYQATDYYLFSSLCHEGHPLSLTEALKSGAKCLASNIDPISEILHEGDLGYLVDNPNIADNWFKAIKFVLNSKVDFNKKNVDLNNLYDFEKWSNEFKSILTDS